MRNLVKVLFSLTIGGRFARWAGAMALAVGLCAPAVVLADITAPQMTATSVPSFALPPDMARAMPKLPAAPEPSPVMATPPRPQPPTATTFADNAVAVSVLQGLLFVSGKEALKAEGAPLSATGDWRVAAQGLPLLNTVEFKQLMRPFVGKPFTLADAAKIRQLTNKWLADHDHPFVNAAIPPQNVDNGVVQVVVTEYRLGKVDVVGARFFSENTVRHLTNLRSGRPMTATDITENASVMNSNPFMTPDINFKEGATPGTTDMEVKVTDRRPLRVYADVDNQGVRSLGLEEFQLGVNWGNVFGTGQIASYQYTRAFSGRYASHSLDDVIPLTALDGIQIFTNFSALSPKVADGFNNTGHNYNASIRYVRTLPFWNQSLTAAHLRIGYDYKYTDNNLLYIFSPTVSLPLLNSQAEVHQFPLIVDGVFADRFGQTAAENDLVYAPGRLTPRNVTAAFQTLTAGARADYVYDKLSLTRTTRLPLNTTWVVRGIFQRRGMNTFAGGGGGERSAPQQRPRGQTA